MGKKQLVWLLAVLLLGGILRFAELGTYGPTPGDDISYLNEVRATYQGLLRAIQTPEAWFSPLRPFFVANNLTQRTYEGKMCFTSLSKPFYVFKLSLFEGWGELSLYWEQFANAVSGILIILVIYFLAALLFSRPAGILASFLGAISIWMIHYSVYGIPTNDSTLFLLLAVLLLIRPKFKGFLFGVAAGMALVFNPTVIVLTATLGLLALIRLLLDYDFKTRRKKLIFSLFFAGMGIVLPWLLWEGGNAFYWSYFGLDHRSFWEALSVCRGDNLYHALKLPVDYLFALRLIVVTDGWPALLLFLSSLIWGFICLKSRPRQNRFGLGVIVVMLFSVFLAGTAAGITQCARHYFLLWPLGLVLIGGFLARLLEKYARSGLFIVLGTCFICFVSSGASFLNYRAARQGWYRLSAWLEENIPPGQAVTPSNQPDNMWPSIPRFSNWEQLEKLEKEKGPTWIIYGDYMAVSRGIWDYPKDMYPIAMACRQVSDEAFTTPTHLGAPIFLHENEDYYWGFVRHPLEPFDPNVRVVSTAKVLELKDSVKLPERAISSPGDLKRGGEGTNVYLPFIEYEVNHPRSPWLGIGGIFVLSGLLWFFCLERFQLLLSFIRRHIWVLSMVLIVLLGLSFRSWGISLYAPMGGDDVEYQTYINKALVAPNFADLGIARPFAMAAALSQLDVNKTITVFSKPFFVLERSILSVLFGGDFYWSHYLACLHGLAAILIVYFLGRRLDGPLAGLIASLIWAISPWAVTYSTWGLHVAGGAVTFGLALWAYLIFRDSPGPGTAVITGLAWGMAIMYSTSNLIPVIFLSLIEVVFGLRRIFSPPRRWKYLGKWGLILVGLLAPLLLWELMSRYCLGLSGLSYRSFPQVFIDAARDNLLHASGLPVDLLFFWRHLFLSEGITISFFLLIGLGVAIWRIIRRQAGVGEEILLVLVFGLTVVMNFAGITQVIRHFFPAFFPLTLLAGLALSRFIFRRQRVWIPLVILLVLIMSRQWSALESFRESRWAPSRVRTWAAGHLYTDFRVGTIPCQLMEIWEGMVRLNNWREVDAFSRLSPPGIMMYGDYIELSLGSWVFSFPEYYEIRQSCRRLDPGSDLFRTPSYLSYLPGRFENEFYYWGLYRSQPPGFDPAIRLISALDIIDEYKQIRSDPKTYQSIWEPTKARPPLVIPARSKAIYAPFMEPMDRPGYTGWLIVSGGIFLFGAWGIGKSNRHLEKRTSREKVA